MFTSYIDQKNGDILCTKVDLAEFSIAKMSDPDEVAPIIALVSTEAVDSDGDIVHQRRTKNGPGWDLVRFNAAPVVTWQHDMRVPNLSGPETRAKVGKHDTKGQGLFLQPLAFDPGDFMAQEIEGKIRRDVLKETSVGFVITHREARKDDEGRTAGLHIYGAKLLEVAIANRGANPDTEMLSKSILSRAGMAEGVEDAGNREIEEIKAEVEHLAQTVAMLSDVIKGISDEDERAAREHIQRANEEKKRRAAELNKCVSELLTGLKSVGVMRAER